MYLMLRVYDASGPTNYRHISEKESEVYQN
jgi:hypothetical protein